LRSNQSFYFIQYLFAINDFFKKSKSKFYLFEFFYLKSNCLHFEFEKNNIDCADINSNTVKASFQNVAGGERFPKNVQNGKIDNIVFANSI
jgi:hypothetical protein